MRDGGNLYRYTYLVLLVMPIAIGYASTSRDISTPLAAKAMPAIKWSLTTTISDETTLASLLNASGGVAGSFSYTAVSKGRTAVPVTADTVLAAGDYTLIALFTPLDETRYRSVTTMVPFTVNTTVKANLTSR